MTEVTQKISYVQSGQKWHEISHLFSFTKVQSKFLIHSVLVIPTSSIEYPGTRHFDTIFEYSYFRVIEPSIRVLDFKFFFKMI